jgi:hypothetical protein
MPFIPINEVFEQLISIILYDLTNNKLQHTLYDYISKLDFPKKSLGKNFDFIYDNFDDLKDEKDNPNISLRFFNTFLNIMLLEKTDHHTIYNFYIEDDLVNYDIIHMDFNVKFVYDTNTFIQIYDFVSEKKDEHIVKPRRFYNELIIELYNKQCK